MVEYEEQRTQNRGDYKTFLSTRETETEPVTVHLIAHSHDDLGWRKTYEEYFYGTNVNNDERAAVQLIIDTTVEELERDKRRTFTIAEMKFFQMWYKTAEQKQRDRAKALIQNGQIEIVQGGWTAPDEACPNYQDLVLNMHFGNKFLWEEF